MALTQSNQLSQLQGDIGNQAIIQDSSPSVGKALDQFTSTAMNTLDTMSKTIAVDKGNALAIEEIENVDKAIAEGERLGAFTEETTEVPETVKMAQEEWDMLSQAVRSGQMNQTTAELVASAGVRKRIAKEPLFARQMRQAASSVLGFNIESKGAQEYFNSFPTRAELAANNKNKYLSDMRDKAAARAPALGMDTDTLLTEMLHADARADQLDSIKNELEMGLISDSQAASRVSKLDSEEALGNILSEIKLASNNGEPVDNIVLGNMITTRQEQFLGGLRKNYQGDINGPEFQRIENSVKARYDGYRDFIDSVGIDNIEQVGLDRMARLRQQIGDRFMNDIQIISEVGGQEAVSQYFTLMSGDLNDTQRAQLLEQFPILKRFAGIAGASNEELKEMLANATTNVLTGRPLSENDKGVIDPVVTKMYNEGNDSTKTNVLDTLRREGMKTKLHSVVFNKSPNHAPVDAVQDIKKDFEKDLPLVYQQVGRIMSEHEGAFEAYIKEDGTVGIKFNSDYFANYRLTGQEKLDAQNKGFTRLNREKEIDTLREINEIMPKIQQYFKGLDNGWGRVLGVDKEELALQATQNITKERDKYLSVKAGERSRELATALRTNMIGGNVDKAREIYEKIQEANPEGFNNNFEAFYEEFRRREAAKQPAGSSGGSTGGY